MPKTSDVGVIVGRFQVHQLHGAHEALIRSVYDTHRQTLVVLGLSQAKVTARNPLDFEARKRMLLAAFPQATVLYLKDHPSDQSWSAKLDAIIRDYVSPAQSVSLYGGRDSFAARYHGTYPVEILEPEAYASGTELRRGISKAVKASPDFRAGVIWASANGYPRVIPTVDIAIYQDIGARTEWLLVRKPTEVRWRFPGGFVSPTDTTTETAAVREAAEETGASLASPQYVASMLVDDWRYRDETDKIMTTLFACQYISGPVRPADDVEEARWFRQEEISPDLLVPEHAPLWEAINDRGWRTR